MGCKATSAHPVVALTDRHGISIGWEAGGADPDAEGAEPNGSGTPRRAAQSALLGDSHEPQG